jgi:hypothetical protein
MKRLLPFVALIVLILGALFSLPYLLQPEKQKARIEGILSNLLKRPVLVGKVSFAYLPPSLQIETLTVSNELGEPFLRIQNIKAPLNLMALLRLKMDPENIDIQGWTLTTYRKESGRWDYLDWWPQATSPSGPKTWELRRARWRSGEIKWVDPFANPSQELVLSLVEGHWDPRPETLETRGIFTGPLAGSTLVFAAKGQFFSNLSWTGDLEITDQAHVFSAQLSQKPNVFEMNARASSWRVSKAAFLMQFLSRMPVQIVDSPHLIESWRLHAKDEPAKLTFTHAGTIGGGPSEAKGVVEWQATSPRVQLEGAVSGVPVEALLVLAGENLPISGKATGITKSLEVVLSSQAVTTLKGEGVLEIVEGSYRVPENSIKKLQKAKTTDYLKKKFPDIASAGLPFSKISAHWQAQKGIVTIDNGVFNDSGFKAGWAGTLDLARKGMDGYLRIDFRETNPALKKLIPLKYHTQPAFGRLQGTWHEWYLKSLPSAKVPTTTRSKLSRASAQK